MTIHQTRTLAASAIIILIAAVGAPSQSLANTNPAKEQITLTLPAVPDGVTDFHLDFKNSAPFVIDKVAKGPFSSASFSSVSGVGGNLGNVTYKGATTPGSIITVGFSIETAKQDFTTTDVSWSYAVGKNTPIPGITGANFKATPIGDPMVDFKLTNTSSGYLLFTNVTTLSNVAELPLGAPVGSIPGFTSLWASLLLAPGQSSPDFISPMIDPGNFIFVEGTSYESNSTGDKLSDSVSWRFGHQTSIPEPATWLMMLFGFGSVGAVMRSRRRRLPPPPKTLERACPSWA